MTEDFPTVTAGTQVRSVAKALMILNVLAEHQREMSLGDIAKEMQLAKSTAYGLLATLRDFGYIEQSPLDGKYRLGIRLFEVGNIVANSWDVRQVAAPFIQTLVDELGETVHLVVLDKGEVLYIDKRESTKSLRIVSQVGTRLPAHCTGVGKVFLANLPINEVRRIIATKGLSRYTKNTITDFSRLEEELNLVRQQGYAMDNEEIMESLRCVAVPLRDHTGKVCAAISVSGPLSRFDGEQLESIVNLIVRIGQEISTSLGYRS
ncbi:IclR family transcriptional regulator [Desulfosporosinus metallidurans]|uniref:Glycerol operon regulatory protein n=1 Tax=Desulfosporosinus metallidurans TaxID=1888891 RepID=A0A1Q8QKK7_9FIRM|nr:IclR family transcriptional regulator [Desulfosporosinus metallidurans]OLN27875.1 Transcriptional regulator, IclR family [Desulfosporosinus metallidurans]